MRAKEGREFIPRLTVLEHIQALKNFIRRDFNYLKHNDAIFDHLENLRAELAKDERMEDEGFKSQIEEIIKYIEQSFAPKSLPAEEAPKRKEEMLKRLDKLKKLLENAPV